MATEALVWPGPPSLTNGFDAQDYTLGVRFSLVAPQDCSGLVWERTSDDVSHTPTGGQWIATLWNWDTQTIITSAPFTPLAAVRQEIPFGASFGLVNGVNYAATIFTQDYTFLAGGGGDIFTPSMNVAADVGVIGVSSDPLAFPAGEPSSWFFVGPRMEIDGPDPAEGTVTLGLDLALSTTGGAGAEGSASVGLGLAVAATGGTDAGGQGALGLNLAVAASGSAPNQGTAALTLGLALDTIGERDSQGSVTLGLNLAVAAGGERDSLGSVALGLNLAVSATGSNGDVGCPIEPFPFASSPLDGYPWTAQPVKSFTGGECS